MSAVDGLVVEVEHRFEAPPERVWALLSDVERMAGLGPEHLEAQWEDAGPAPGARFTGRNRREGREWSVSCQVTVCERPWSFGWMVGDPQQPSSRWTYDIQGTDTQGTAAQTRVTQRFELGPGVSFLRRAADTYPERAAEIVAARSAELERNMRAALQAAEALL